MKRNIGLMAAHGLFIYAWTLACFLFVLLPMGPISFGCDNCIAQQKANQQANEGRMRHVGGSFGSGRFEGVGFSTSSADQAIRACCYWGQRTPVGIGVARGARGWFATVLYR